MAPAIEKFVTGASMPLNVAPGVCGHPSLGCSFSADAFNSGSLFIRSAGVHTSAGVPPQFALMRPTGTLRSAFNFLPKKKPTALKALSVLESQSVHDALQSSCGVDEVVFGI